MFHSKIKSDYFNFSEIKGEKLTKHSKYFHPQSTQLNFSIMVWSVDHGRAVTWSACLLYGIKRTIWAKAFEGFSVLGGFSVFLKSICNNQSHSTPFIGGFPADINRQTAADKIALFRNP